MTVYNYNEQKNEWEVDNEHRAAYENRINEMGLAELNRYMKGQAKGLYEARQVEEASTERDRLPDKVAEEDLAPLASPRTGGGQTTRVRFDREAELLHDAISVGEASVREPGDARSRDREYWVRESDPELVRRDLKDRDAAWADQIDDMLINYNERNPKGRLTRDQYIDQYTALVTSSVAPLQELSNLGILGTVEGRVMVPGKLAPTESILDLGTAGGRSLIQSLMKSGGLPSSLQDNVQSLRRRFTDTMKTRFEALDKNIRDVVATMKLSDGIELLYVDDANGLHQFLRDVTIRGEDMSADLVAMYDRPGNRIIINLAAIDPNDMRSAQEIVRDAAFEEGLHALLIRHHLTLEEKEILYNFVRNQENIVPNEIDPSAYSAKLTWFERAVVEASSTGRGMKLPEADIENEAVIALLGNLVRHPDIYVGKTKVRKVGKDIRGFLEGFVDAAKDADIVDVLKILGRIESGAVGDRGAGFLGEGPYTTTSIIRSNDLFRYANPQDIEQLRAAVILQEAAPSEQMRASEQAKIDDIVDKIVANQDAIQGSAQPAPNAEQAIEDERQKIQHMRDTHAGQMPLIGLDQSKKNSEAYKIAINTFMEMRGQDPKYAYKMPEPYQTFMNNRSTITPKLQNIVDGLVADGTIAPPDKNAARKRFEKEGVLSGNNFYAGAEHVLAGQIESKELEISSGEMSPERAEKAKAELKTLKDELRELASKRAKEATGDTIEGTRENFKKTADELRYNYLDRRQWVVKQTDRIMAAQNRAQLDAETSALVMWRNSDNALNWLPSLMLRGPLSYLGVSVERGKFENAPAYDRGLREKHGGDGRIQGLNDILEPIIDEADQSGALAYGLAKRILWTKSRRDSFVRAVGDPGKIPLAPEVRRKLELFEEAYEDINPGEKLTEDRLNEIVREVEGSEGNKEIVEFWDRYNAYDNHMINLAYDTGMITREQRDEWMSMPYAPFYRDTAEVSDFPIGSHGEIQKRGINMVEKSLRASMEPLKNDLAGSIIENTQALVRDSMMNVAVARTVRDALALGEARKISISSLAGSVNNRVVRVMEKGVPVFYELSDPQLAMSSMMLGHNPKRQLQKLFGEHKVGTLAQRALTGASSLLRESVTRTLAFAQKNVFRDSWTAMNLTGGGPLLVLEAFKNAFSVDSLRRADELGLSIGIDFIADPGEYGNKMRSELKKANLDWKNPFNGLSTFWNFTGRISKQSEVATRLAVYDRILALTGDKALAVHYAIEIMNYGRRGASPVLSTFMSTVPFMNGRLEGLDVTYRGLRAKKGSSDIPGIHGYGLTADQYDGLPWWKKSRGQILGRGALLTAATGALYMLMRDDEEWQDLREEVKADNWVLPLSDHAWLKIPIPFEIGVIFKVIPEKIFEAVIEKDVDAADVGEETWRQIRSTLSLVGYPQLFAPVIGAMRNYDVFRKDAIVDHWMEETLSPNEQRSLYTSNVARGIADLANSVPLVRNLDFLTSPMKVEYMVRQYVGTTGGYVVTMADRLARTGILPDLPFDPYMNLARAESVVGTNKDFDFKSMIGGEGVANVPILGDLLTDPRTRSGRQQQFFQMITELDTILATLRSITERDRKKGFSYAEKHRNVLRHQNQLRFVQGQLRDWRERRGHLEKISSQAMSMDDKRAYYQRLLRSRADILAGVDRIMSSIKQG